MIFRRSRTVLIAIKLIICNAEMDAETKLKLIEDEVKSVTWL